MTRDLDLASGGLSGSAYQLSECLAGHFDATSTLVYLDLSRPTVVDPQCDCLSRLAPLYGRDALFHRQRTAVRRRLDEIHRQTPIDVIHAHGIWTPLVHWSLGFARSRRIPHVISPQGMLEPWSMTQKTVKKNAAWLAYQRRDLERCSCIHATAEEEARNLRGLGLSPPFVVLPNIIEFPPAENRRPCIVKPVRKLLFLSRIHPKKGLPLLVDAWKRVRPSGWSCAIAGPDEKGHRAEIRSRLEEAGISDSFEFLGQISGSDRWPLLMSADLFVLPTLSENFGNVIGEALACGVPVITTRGAPWDGIREARCGWWVDTDVESLAAALAEATGIDDEQLRTMGQRGRTWVDREFGRKAVTHKMLSVYEWITGGPSPAANLLA